MIVILSGVALGGLIAASPTLISDWIFRTGQHTFTVYNSSTQAIESVDNRNKGRKQYGALSVDGALYANSTINATGAINIGADVSLTRSAADVLTTADSIVSATHTVNGDVNLGAGTASKRLMFQDANSYKMLNVANYYASAGYIGMLKFITPISATAYTSALVFEFTCLSYNNVSGKAYVSVSWNGSTFVANYTNAQTEGLFTHREIIFGIENDRVVIVLASPFYNTTSMRVDLLGSNRPNAATADYGRNYSLVPIASLTGITNQLSLTAAASLGKIFINGVVIGTNKTTLTAGYVLDVSGAAYVSGTIYGAGNISGLTFTDRTPGSPEDALSEIGAWKVVGDQVDHDSLGKCLVFEKVEKPGFEISNKEGEAYNSVIGAWMSNAKGETTGNFSLAVEDFKAGKELPAEYTVKEVTEIVYEKGRDLSKTVSILSRAVQQLTERIEKLEGR